MYASAVEDVLGAEPAESQRLLWRSSKSCATIPTGWRTVNVGSVRCRKLTAP